MSKWYAFFSVRKRLLPCTRKCLGLPGFASVLQPLACEPASFLHAHYRLETRLQQREASVARGHSFWERLGHLRQAITKNTAASASQDHPERCIAAEVDTQVDLATNSFAAQPHSHHKARMPSCTTKLGLSAPTTKKKEVTD